MAKYSDDLHALARLGRLRVVAIVLAIVASAASVALDMPWLMWLRALGWGGAGAVAFLTARCEKRLGRDPDGSYVRSVLYFLFAAIGFWMRPGP
jgi:hypothetical protein